MKKRIFITGGLGSIGSCVAEELEKNEEYEVIRGTRSEGDGNKIIHVDYDDPLSFIEVLRNVHTVIHLAYYLMNDNFVSNHIDSCLKSAYNLYESARVNGVKRVIFGSSNHIFGFYKMDDHITSNSPYRPDCNYAVSKVFVENLGRYYSDRFGISVFNIRIGNFSHRYFGGNSKPLGERETYVWLSNPDCQQLFRKCVEHDEDCRYLQMFGMSNNTGCWFDTSDNEVIGYEPQSNGANFRGSTGREMPPFEYVGGTSCYINYDGSFDNGFIEVLKEGVI